MSDGVQHRHHEFVTAKEAEKIDQDPVLTIEDVANHRREADGS